VQGATQNIENWLKNADADIESMEGAACFYVCLLEKIPFLEVRSISNYVEPRNRANWNLPLAIQNLNQVLVEMIDGFVG
jgi:futalosine hydrolase